MTLSIPLLLCYCDQRKRRVEQTNLRIRIDVLLFDGVQWFGRSRVRLSCPTALNAMDKELKVDTYGQVVVPSKWYNVFTWEVPGKYALYLSSMTGACLLGYNRVQRRPWYAGAAKNALVIAAMAGAGYAAGTYRDHTLRNRDRVIAHYMSLHPEDFSHMSGNVRCWKDVLLPWNPVRYFESPYKWTPKPDDY
uniref:NADH dehydrogenase [ubiquinone] 1 subunit C2 n=1 Tax=Trichuris muris TaxID=70415 RepID=A0A5S6QWU6_TRIMR